MSISPSAVLRARMARQWIGVLVSRERLPHKRKQALMEVESVKDIRLSSRDSHLSFAEPRPGSEDSNDSIMDLLA